MKWFIVIILALFVSTVDAETRVWEPINPGTNLDWHIYNNWDPVGVPKETDDVVINNLICNIYKPARANFVTVGHVGWTGYLNISQDGELYANRIALGEHSTGSGLLALMGKNTLVEVDKLIIGDRGDGSLVMYGGTVLAKKVELDGIIDCSWGMLKTESLFVTGESLIVFRRGIICGYEYHPIDIYEDSDWIINYKDFAVLAEHWLESQY